MDLLVCEFQSPFYLIVIIFQQGENMDHGNSYIKVKI